MQAIVRISQARPRAHRREFFRQHIRQLGAVGGELLALASLTAALTALTAGMTLLAGLLG